MTKRLKIGNIYRITYSRSGTLKPDPSEDGVVAIVGRLIKTNKVSIVLEAVFYLSEKNKQIETTIKRADIIAVEVLG